MNIERNYYLYAEIYRQNYVDALDEIRNLKMRIRELENENDNLRSLYHNEAYSTNNYTQLYREG
jgi:hypothetical protein